MERIEDIVTRMQDDKTGGVPIRTVKSFLSKIPSVVTGSDIVQWLMKNLSIEDAGEAIHLGSLIAAQGYVFPISDHVLTLKDDGTFYRFQAPYFWPSNCWEPENTDYAIYLCKRTMQNKARLELADYEAENLARLQRAFARKWEFIFMQAEAQVKIDRKKDKTERKILDSQERAFWDVHRPVPGCVNTTEMDIRKCRRMKNPQKVKKSVYGVTEESQPQSPVHLPSQPVRKTTKEDFRKQITFLNMQIERHCLKMSKVAESLIAYTEQYVEYDPFITPAEPSNPWISDDAALWDIEMSKEPSQQRVKRWGFSMDEVLKDPVGRDQFLRFLESEFSSENLRFWLAVQDLKKQPLQDVTTRVEEIWQEFLAPGAQSAINLDSHSYEKTSQNVKDPGRYTYEDAQARMLLAFLATWAHTGSCSAAVDQHPQVLSCGAAFQPLIPQPVALHEAVVTQVWDLALDLAESLTIGLGPLIQPVQIPLQSLPVLQQINTPIQFSVICELADGALDPFIRIINKDIK
ncbi:hypothetical protein HGM15179_000879 [Zosterops borbonicus]|uniref:Regulator of G-protein signaling 6 n=1 Tax=Zosterops borbonicus TaxID=364589 RepID=A0A8K1LU80_9PASS|nr:hypothetical protein HGM15179_000879 [Zosterops borbonicus]